MRDQAHSSYIQWFLLSFNTPAATSFLMCLYRGQQFAAQVSQQNPELVETLREEMGKDNNQPKDDDQQQS